MDFSLAPFHKNTYLAQTKFLAIFYQFFLFLLEIILKYFISVRSRLFITKTIGIDSNAIRLLMKFLFSNRLVIVQI